ATEKATVPAPVAGATHAAVANATAMDATYRSRTVQRRTPATAQTAARAIHGIVPATGAAATSLRRQDDGRPGVCRHACWNDGDDVGQRERSGDDEEEGNRCYRVWHDPEIAGEDRPRPTSGGHAKRQPDDDAYDGVRRRLPGHRGEDLPPIEAECLQDCKLSP